MKIQRPKDILLPFPHIFFFFAFFVFFTLLFSKILKFDRYLFFKTPLPPFTKFYYKTLIEIRSFMKNKNKEDAKYEQTNTDLIQELEDHRLNDSRSQHGIIIPIFISVSIFPANIGHCLFGHTRGKTQHVTNG